MIKLKRLSALIMVVVMMLTTLTACTEKITDVDSDGLISLDPVVADLPQTDDTEEITEPVTEATTKATTTVATTTTEATSTAAVTTTAAGAFTVEELSATMYATGAVNVRSGPNADYDRIGGYQQGAEVTVTGRASTGWYRVDYKGSVGYVSNAYLSSEPVATAATTTTKSASNDDVVDIDDNNSSSNTTSSTVTNVSYGEWVSDNGWETIMSYWKDSTYVTVLNEIMEGIQNFQTEITISPLIDADHASAFANYILPILAVEYCYVESIGAKQYTSGTYTGYLSKVTVSYYVNYQSEADKMVSELRTKADSIISNLTSSMTDYQKVKYLTEWIVLNCVCAEDAESSGGPYGASAYGALVDGRPTCAGYAKGLFYLLSRAGFDVVFQIGTGVSARHLWVKVKINGSWYNVDPTWCDPYTPTLTDASYIDYSFLCCTDSLISATHSEVFNMTFYTVPSATSTTYDWYVMNGYYATTLSEALSILISQTKTAVSAGGKYVYIRLKVANSDIYDELTKSYFVNNVLSSVSTSYKYDGSASRSAGLYRVYRLTK